MKKLDIPKGVYRSESKDQGYAYETVFLEDSPQVKVESTYFEHQSFELAKLIEDTANTYQECETLPSELLKQNEIMGQIIQKMKNHYHDAMYFQACNGGADDIDAIKYADKMCKEIDNAIKQTQS